MDSHKKNACNIACSSIDLEVGDINGSRHIENHGHEKRTGSFWVFEDAHVITAVIGSGVFFVCLALAITHLFGWLVGHVSLIVGFSVIAYYTFTLLANPASCKQNQITAIQGSSTLGEMKAKLCGIAIYAQLVGVTIGYTIAASISMVAVKRSNRHGDEHKANSKWSNFPYMITFALIQIVLSQITKFDKLSWLSIVVAVMSFVYSSTTALYLRTSLDGVEVWLTFPAIGDIVFAFAYSTFLTEILICYHQWLHAHQLHRSNYDFKPCQSNGECISSDSVDLFGRKLDLQHTVQKNKRGQPNWMKQQEKQVIAINEVPTKCSDSTTSKFVCLDLMESNKKLKRNTSHIMAISDLKYYHQSCYNHPLMNGIPVTFHPYVSRIQNVRGDGNCGFRTIAVCLGYEENQWLNMRKQLLDELNDNYVAYARVFGDGIKELQTSLSFFDTDAPKKYWMIMPLTGLLVANKFGVIVIYLSKRGSLTIFPFWKGPEEFSYHKMITISFVNGKHYVMVQLEGNFPMPTISTSWIRHKAVCAAAWETKYMLRLELYRQLTCTPEAHVITIEDR